MRRLRSPTETMRRGRGYSLLVRTSDGAELKVDVYAFDGLPYLLRHSARDISPLGLAEVFINPANVCSVTVLW